MVLPVFMWLVEKNPIRSIEQARKDFGNHQFHSKQATVLKLWMIDMKEFITKHEKKNPIINNRRRNRREEVLSSIDEMYKQNKQGEEMKK